jgi:hypothetical protein
VYTYTETNTYTQKHECVSTHEYTRKIRACFVENVGNVFYNLKKPET